MAEVLTGQSATDAVQKNLPVQSTLALQQPALRYPLQGRALEKGKTYAWQIVARDQNQFSAKSEVWTFTVKNDSTNNATDGTSYIKVTSKPLSPVFAINGILKAEYYHELADSVINIKIFNVKHSETVLFSSAIPVKHGQNFLQYDLTRKLKLDEGECYEARFINAADKVSILRIYPKYNNK